MGDMGKRATVRIWGLPLVLFLICAIACGLAASAQAEAPSQASCVAAALARPGNVESDMSRPGNKWEQEILVAADFDPTSAGCLPLVARSAPRAIFKMQSPKNHRRWTRTKGLDFLDESNGTPFPPIGADGGTGIAVYGPPPGRPKPLKHFLYRCSPGKAVTHVRVVITLKVTSAADGSLLGHKSYSWPVHIQGGAFAFAGGVKKAC
jgi:hypothetical protein